MELFPSSAHLIKCTAEIKCAIRTNKSEVADAGTSVLFRQKMKNPVLPKWGSALWGPAVG